MTEESKQLQQKTDSNLPHKDMIKVNLSLEAPEGVRLNISVGAQPTSLEESIPTKDRPNVLLENLTVDEDGVYSIEIPVRYAESVSAVSEPVYRKLSTRIYHTYGNLRNTLQDISNIWPYSFTKTLFGFSLLIYLLVRLVGLTSFPIYFFSDEAVQTNLAADFLRDNFIN